MSNVIRGMFPMMMKQKDGTRIEIPGYVIYENDMMRKGWRPVDGGWRHVQDLVPLERVSTKRKAEIWDELNRNAASAA